jgi:endonuclease-3
MKNRPITDSETISEILQILQHTYGNTTTALKYGTRFQLLVSTILSAQTTDKQVNKITENLYSEYPDAAAFLRLSQTELEAKIKAIGLYRSKAKNILATCKILMEKYNGEVPETRGELEKLPGVGRKTASVVLSVGFNQDAIAVDTHVFRVSNRIGLVNTKTAEKTELQLMEVIPQNYWSAAHHWLIWHGRIICKAQNPKCTECPISYHCSYYKNLK